MTITIHDANLRKIGWIDNEKQDTLNFYDDLWIRDLATGSSTFEFTVTKKVLKTDSSKEKLYEALNERAFVSFEHNGKTYLFNVMEVEETEKNIKCFCETLNLELLNEIAQPYESKTPKTFVEYATAMDLLNYTLLTVGLNEIKTKKLALSFSSDETKLARLLNLVAQFGAEIEFETQLKPNSQLKSFKINIYHGHDSTHHGVGSKRSDLVLRYGKNLKSITRKVSKKNLYTVIYPVGKRSDTTKNRKTTVTNPDGTQTITDKVAQPDGNYTVTTTKVDKSGKVLSTKKVVATKQSDGSIKKSTSTNVSGSVSTTSSNTNTVKNKDGSTTTTTTVTKSDGAVEKTIVHTKITKLANKTTITVVTTTKPDGSVVERTTTKYANGSKNTQTKVLKAATKKNTTSVSKVDSSNDSEFDLSGLKDWKKTNAKGELEFYKRGTGIFANLAKDLYPSTFTSKDASDQWIRIDKEFEADSEEELNALALEYLESVCYPEITYEINGSIAGEIGDSVWIEDDGFSKVFQATARISRQEISQSNPSRNKTVVTNVNVVKSMLSDGITARLNELAEAAQPYDIRLETNNGTAFKNGEGSSTVIATLLKGAFEVNDNVSFEWLMNSSSQTSSSYTVSANDVAGTAQLEVIAYVGVEEVARRSLTFTDVTDGKQGKAGTSSYTYWAYSAHADGHDMAEQPGADTVYAGQCATDSKTRPSDYRLYTWSKIKGDKGDTGNGINSVSVSYGSSTSNTVRPTTWTSAIPDVPAGQYLWTRTIIDYTDSSKADTVTYTYSKMGRDGEPGEPGQDGTSVTVKSIQYQAGSSPTTSPTGSWSANLVPVPAGQYLWTKTMFSDNTTAYSVARQGEKGADGKGISRVEELYLASSNGTGITTNTAGWSTTVPAMTAKNKYLWNYTKTTFTDNSVTMTTPAVIGSLGADGASGKGIQSITEYYLASDKNTGITTSTAGWTTTMQPVSVDKKYLWNYSVTRFTDNSTQTSQVLLIGAYGDTGTFEGEIGGVNYFSKKAVVRDAGVSDLPSLNIRGKETPNGFKVTGTKTNDGTVRINNVINSNGPWTVSFDFKGEQSIPVALNVDICDQGVTRFVSNSTNTYQRMSLTVNVTKYSDNPSIYNFVDFSNLSWVYYYIDRIKIEKGTVATDWSPAPEDIQDQIDSKAPKEEVVYKADINVANEGIIHSASKTVNGQTIASMIAQRAEWVEIIARLLKVKGDMLVDGSITSTKFNGNVISSLDGTLVFDLAKSSLVSYSDNSVIRRVSDNQSQFIKMATANKITYTTIGANRAPNDETIGNANFTGLQFRSRSSANGGLVDEAEIWADSFYLSGGSAVGDGIHFKNNQWVRPMASGKLYLGTNDFKWREVHSNEYYINGVVLSTYLKAIRDCFVQLMNGGATQSTYDYIKGKVSAYLNKLP